MRWQVQEAKQRFSELVRRATQEGPQIVTRHGEEVVVVVAAEEFRRSGSASQAFKDFLRSAPDWEALDIRRDATKARVVTLPRRRGSGGR